jgi:CRP-like cAMP-binding protein
VSLLDLDDDLAQECGPEVHGVARAVTGVRLCVAEVGPCDLAPWFSEVAHGPGLLLLDGLLAVNTSVGQRVACELVGGGDLLQPFEPRAEELITRHESCQALAPTSFALLDESFAARAGACPQVGMALFRRAARRSAEAETLRAISSHPRLEVRLVLLFWHMASRWGKVGPSGIRLTLPLTHRLLGQLVAAERPSVSHALHRLAQTELVTGTAGDLLLRGSLEAHFEALREPLTDHLGASRLALARPA